MKCFYSIKVLQIVFAATAFLLAADEVQAREPWETWQRDCFTKDMGTEWLVASDRDETGLVRPEKVVIYLLVPPTITQEGTHWEITFDSTGKKKNELAEHFDNAKASDPQLSGFRGMAMHSVRLFLDGVISTDKGMSPCWLTICSKSYWAGKRDQPNVCFDGSGIPNDYNLDPDEALGISFLEPVITEKDGEWILSVSAPTDHQESTIPEDYARWMSHHPDPPTRIAPPLHYPPSLQKQYDAWNAALQQWRNTPPAPGASLGEPPKLEDFLHLSPEQQDQYKAWQKAYFEWMDSQTTMPCPQPSDYIHQDATGN